MDFLSNLIKRPISLVLNETSTTLDKYKPISTSVPNTPNNLEIKTNAVQPAPIGEELLINFHHNNNNIRRSLSMTSSCNGDNMTDLIGVPEDFLDEFKDIVPPPPPPPLTPQNTDPTYQSHFYVDKTICSLSVSPPLPPLLSTSTQSNPTPTPSMKASQIIDELLLQINDNLQETGLNNEILAIATPPELSPLSNKAALNNSKALNSSASSTGSNHQMTVSKTPSTTAAGSANTIVYENNSSLYNFHIDPKSDTAGIFVDRNNQEQLDLLTNSVNKLSNKFMGLTEFDEAKIPELPGDLNPNIEDQYKETFEECLIATLDTEQGTKEVPDEFIVDKIHLVLPTESDAISSENETFADCNDERDPLATTYAGTNTLDATADLESYESACNNATIGKIADLTLEADGHISHHKVVEIQVVEDEPMDVDMNSTMEILTNTPSNIQHVENVLQHNENNLQCLQDNMPLHDVNVETVPCLLEKLSATTTNTLVENLKKDMTVNFGHHIEMEQLENELYANKSHELLLNNSKTISTECIIETLNKEDLVNLESTRHLNGTNESMNFSTASNSSAKSSVTEGKTETKLNLSMDLSTSMNSQKSLDPTSPSFPIKASAKSGFPRSPKSVSEKSKEIPYLEKSDYFANIQNKVEEIITYNDVNQNYVETTTNNINVSLSTSSQHPENIPDINNKRHTFSIDTIKEKSSDVENSSPHKQVIPIDKPDNTRRTFSVNETVDVNEKAVPDVAENKIHIRRTFNLLPTELSEENGMNVSTEAMEVDEPLSQNLSLAMRTDIEQRSENLQSPAREQSSQSSLLSDLQQTSDSSSLSEMQELGKSPLPTTEQISQSSTLSTMQQSSQSPLHAKQHTPQSSPLTLQTQSQYPLLRIIQPPSQSPPSPTVLQNEFTVPSGLQVVNIKEEPITPPSFESTNLSFASQSLPAFIQKRPPIRDARTRAAEILSAKERSNIRVKDEKDVNVEKFTPSPKEVVCSASSSSVPSSFGLSEFNKTSLNAMGNDGEPQSRQELDEEFTGNNFILNAFDFDYLLTKGNNNANTPVARSSLLLKFDPLLGVAVPVNQGQQQLQLPTNTIYPSLSPTLEEDEHNDSNHSFVVDTKQTKGCLNAAVSEGGSIVGAKVKQELQLEQQFHQNKRQLAQGRNKKNATMSVDVIKDMNLDNDCNKAFENSNSHSDDKQINYKMDEIEKKIKNEVLKTDDIEKKLKDAEQREEALIKRITEKDKTITKMTGVIEAYEKAIAELITDKEQLTQQYEKQLAEVKADRDSNYHHLTSLETTFSDLHVKYEKSKEMTCQLKESEESLQAERRKNLENLHLQEKRYEKMKNHAIQQLEIANKKLESLTRDHSTETTKLKILLKKEEISRSSISELLNQKTKENAELVKICDELIAGQES